MSKINKTSAETRLAIERRSAAMLPDRPTQAGYKPWDIRNALFSAIIADKGACLMGEIDRIVDETNAAIAAMRIESGTLTVPTNRWKGEETPRAECAVGSLYTAGCAVLFIPEDDETKEQARIARLSMAINETLDGEWSDLVVFVGEGGDIPSVDLHFRYIVIPTESKADAIVALVGVDAYGEDGGGVDEDAVKKIINSMLGNVANERQYSAANPPPYPVTSVNSQSGAVKLSASDVGARPSTWMPTAADVGADPVNTAQTLVNDLASKTAQNLANYYTKSQTLTKDEINALVSAIPKFSIEVVTSLPTSNISETTVYLVKSGDDDTNLYTEYIRTGGKWEKLGTQTVDLTGYATEAWVNDILAAYVKTVDLNEAIAAALTTAKESGEFDGKTAHQYAQDGGYTGTEEEFAAKLANAVDKRKITLGIHPDGLLYVFVNGSPVGNGIEMVGGGATGDVIGTLDESMNIVLEGELADGTYTLKFKNADGTYSDLCKFEVGDVKPPYNNLAEPNADNTTDPAIWINNNRLNATGGVEAYDDMKVTNYVAITANDEIRIKNFKIQRIGFYKSDKTAIGAGTGSLTNLATNAFIFADYTQTDTETYIKIKASSPVYLRFSGWVNDGKTAEDVIITKNETIPATVEE